MSVKQIFEGWRNHIAPQASLQGIISRTSQERLSICEQCPFHSKNFKTFRLDEHCTDCGCTLAAKTKCLSCKCPRDKWDAVLTPEEEKKFRDEQQK